MDIDTNIKQQVKFFFFYWVWYRLQGFRNSVSLWSYEFEHYTEENFQWRELEVIKPWGGVALFLYVTSAVTLILFQVNRHKVVSVRKAAVSSCACCPFSYNHHCLWCIIRYQTFISWHSCIMDCRGLKVLFAFLFKQFLIK